MNTAKRVISHFIVAYVITLSAGALWLYYQPEPFMPEMPNITMLVAGEAFEAGAGGIFCDRGIAWVETEKMGINIPMVVDGDLMACRYTSTVEDWTRNTSEPIETFL